MLKLDKKWSKVKKVKIKKTYDFCLFAFLQFIMLNKILKMLRKKT